MRGLRRTVLEPFSKFLHSLDTSARQAEWLRDVLFGLAEEQLQSLLCESGDLRDGRIFGSRMVFVPLPDDVQTHIQPKVLLRTQPLLSAMLNDRLVQWIPTPVEVFARVSHGRIVLTVTPRQKSL